MRIQQTEAQWERLQVVQMGLSMWHSVGSACLVLLQAGHRHGCSEVVVLLGRVRGVPLLAKATLAESLGRATIERRPALVVRKR